MNWLFSIYQMFVVAVIVRYLWLLWELIRGKAARGSRPHQDDLRTVTVSLAFLIAVLVIVALSMLGLPVGHSMIGGSVLYLLIKGMDMGTAAEQLLNGMYSSFLLLAIPLFILAAEFMNSGAIMERLLTFCNALVGRFPRRHGARQRGAERDLHCHVRLRARRCGELGEDYADDDDQGRALSARFRRSTDGGFRSPGTHHPTLHSHWWYSH
jgi:hypothetical protein